MTYRANDDEPNNDAPDDPLGTLAWLKQQHASAIAREVDRYALDYGAEDVLLFVADMLGGCVGSIMRDASPAQRAHMLTLMHRRTTQASLRSVSLLTSERDA